MSIIIDKRFLPKNSTSASREKFIDRYKKVIKSKIKDMIGKGTIKGFNKGNKKVKIQVDDLDTPGFEFEPGTGNTDRIYIGNKEFTKGQRVRRPSGKGKGSGGGRGKGEDDFEFVLTEKEYLDLFFEDLALPDMAKKQFLGSCFEIKHAGYSRYGGPSSLNIKKTMLNALGRRIALKGKKEKELEDLLKQTNRSVDYVAHSMMLSGKELSPEAVQRLKDKRIVEVLDIDTDRTHKIQFIEDMDLKYNFKDKVDVPTTKAVMICLMDVSGSMGEKEKDLAKRFYILLNLFLERNYDIVDLVFVRHADTAMEVDEDTFFHMRISGGTIISTGYELVSDIITKRYNPDMWNIYVAQTSDGENFTEDMPEMKNLLLTRLLPVCQYFAYVDICSGGGFRFNQGPSDVMRLMNELAPTHKNLQAREVYDYSDIFPVFRSLFKKGTK